MPREKIVQIVKGADGVRHLVERPSMTHQEKLTFIRAKCIEANPEIAKPAFGCITEYGIVVGIRYSDAIQAHQYAMAPTRIDRIPELRTKEELGEIIGRPITLADVLLAMNQKAETSWYWSVNTTGAWFDGRESVTHILCEWKLRKDDLNEQGEATISFLYDVLN